LNYIVTDYCSSQDHISNKRRFHNQDILYYDLAVNPFVVVITKGMPTEDEYTKIEMVTGYYFNCF
jgi:hypothetical protein